MIKTKMESDSPQMSPIQTIYGLARRHKILVEYQLEKESGPAHAKLYTMRLNLGEKQYTGVDRSIKSAQRAAAQSALDEHKHLLVTDTPKSEPTKQQSSTVVLNTWATQHHVPTRYILLNEEQYPIVNNYPTPIFYYRLFIGHDLVFDGHGTSHQKARINCAEHALHYIRQNQMFDIKPNPTEVQVKSQISVMYERARQLGLPVRMEQQDSKTITYFIGEELSATGTGKNKQLAKEKAAEKMLEILPLPEEKVKAKPQGKHGTQHQKFIEQKDSNDYSSSETINPITRLYQIGVARNQAIQFTEIETNDKENKFHFHVKFGEEDSADGYGQNKKTAKRLAAENLLVKLNVVLSESIPSIKLPPPPKKSLLKREESEKTQQEKKHVHFVEDQSLSRKEQLNHACEELDITVEYQEQILVDQIQSILSLSKDDRLLAKFRGHGLDTDEAQENAANAAWKNLHELFKPLSIRK